MYAMKTVLRFKLKTNFEFSRLLCTVEPNSQLFTTHLGVKQPEPNKNDKLDKLKKLDPKSVAKIVRFCEQIGFNQKDVLKNPMLLRLHLCTLDQYFTVMQEGGFINITPNIIAKFRTHYRKNIYTLKEQGFIDPQTNVTKSFIKHLSPCPENFYVKTEDDGDIWSDVHLKVLTEYLKWRLNASDDDVNKLIKVHTTICRKSFKYLCENIALAEDLGFSPEKMLKYGYILQAYPKYTKEILEKYPTIAGACMRRAMRMYPKLVTTPPSNIEKILNILKEHNIPDETICKRMNVFHMSPETVDLRLKELERTADFKVLLHNPNVLKLVVHHNRAKSRLSFLNQLQLKCASVSVLGNDDIKFEIHIREGRDTNTFSDTYAYLKGIFKKEIDEFVPTLKRHPYYLQVPLKSMENTYSYLKSEKYTNSSIFQVVYILLYPKEKIENALKQVDDYENQSRKTLTQVNRLNLVLYFIEKEHHFTGDGIWVKNESVEENVHTP